MSRIGEGEVSTLRVDRRQALRRTTFSCGRRARLVVGAVLFLAGCQPAFQGVVRPLNAVSERERENTARLSVFLNLKEPEGPGVQLKVAAVEVLTERGWVPVSSGPLQLDSERIRAAQVVLGSRVLPPGRYRHLRLQVTEGSVRSGEGGIETASVPAVTEVELPSPLVLNKEESECAFITWDVEGSLARGGVLRPSLMANLPVRQLPVDLVYAACPEMDTVFVIRADRDWVADSFGVKGFPTHLALGPPSSAQRLYVLTPKENAVKVVDLTIQKVIDSFRVPFVSSPTFMTVSPDGQWAYVLDESESFLGRIDLISGALVARTRLRYRPQYATYLGDRSVLAVASSVSQAVSLHDPLNLAELASLGTGRTPEGLLAWENKAYVAERGANAVSVWDLATRTVQSRVFVGGGPRRLLRVGNEVYVSNYDDGSVSVLLSGHMGVARETRGLGRPLEMVGNQTYRKIYVGDEQMAGLGVIDGTTSSLRGYVQLGARPAGLVAVE